MNKNGKFYMQNMQDCCLLIHMRKAVCGVLIALAFMFAVEPCLAADWQEVTTIDGRGEKVSESFYVPSSEWRIAWNYSSLWGDYAVVEIYVREQGSGKVVAQVVSSAGFNNGVEYVNDSGPGNYDLEIIGGMRKSYTLRIEIQTAQPTETPTTQPTATPAAPEFPVASAITVLLLIGAASAVFIFRPQKSQLTDR